MSTKEQALSGRDEMTETKPTMFEDHDAERAVMGALFLDETKVSFLLNSKRFVPDMFAMYQHQIIYNTILSMQAKALPIDVMTVEKRLADKGNLDKAGGLGCCTAFLDAIPTESHAEYYVDLVIEKHRLRSLNVCVQNMDMLIKDGQSSVEITSKVMSDIMAQVEMPMGTPAKELHDTTIREAEETRRMGKIPGMTSFFPGLNDILGGFVDTNVYVLAARPSEGKSCWACNEAIHNAVSQNVPAAFVSMEMSEKLIRDTMAGSISGVSSYAFRMGKYSDIQLEKIKSAYDKLLAAPLYINDARMSIEEIVSWLSYTVQKHNVKFVAIDYLQLIKPSKFLGHASRNEQVMNWSAAIKDFTKRSGVVTLLVSQMSRAGVRLADTTPPPPTLEALRDSGSIEQDADGVIFLYKAPGKNYSEFNCSDWSEVLEVAKNRIGPIGATDIVFCRSKQRFDGRAEYDFRQRQNCELPQVGS